MNSLVRDVMTSGVVAAERATPFKEDVARPAQHRIKGNGCGTRTGACSSRHRGHLLLKQEYPNPKAAVALIGTKVCRRSGRRRLCGRQGDDHPCGHHGAHRGGR